jgi:glycosyltransferase involved in cell wall biosynthesis
MISNKPKVTVCIVTYNQERYIKDCLLSVLTQAYDVDLEILVGDDASTDNTSQIVRDIAKEHPGHITVFRHENNLGAQFNSLFLIERATGDYVAHLDGDDYWMPGKLEAQVAFLDDHPECVAVYSNAVLINEAKDIQGAFNCPQPEVFDLCYLLKRGNYLNNSSLLYRQHVKQVIFNLPLICFDYQFHLRFATKGKLGYVNQMLVAYRVGSIGSAIIEMSEAVRRISFTSISEVSPFIIDKSVVVKGYAYFLSDILYLSIKSVRIKYGFSWLNCVLQENKKHYALFLYYVIIYTVIRLFIKTPMKKLYKIFNPYKLYVMFTRRLLN